MSAQFLLASACVLCVSMAILGTWVNLTVTSSVLTATGVQANHFMEAFLEPHVQNLEPDGVLRADARRALDDLLSDTPLMQTTVAVKIWRGDGLVLYATNKDLIGQTFNVPNVTQAMGGEIVTEFESTPSDENSFEKAQIANLIEVYAPLYRTGTDEVIAVAETYERADALISELDQSQATTWIVVAITTSFMVGLLYLIVRRAEAIIVMQQKQLSDRYTVAAELRQVADRSRLQASEANEQYLAQLGADIHDGPLQLLTLSILRLTAAAKAIRMSPERSQDALDKVEGTIHITQDAMTDLRNVSTGLSLPEISGLTLAETVHLAVHRHEDLTGERVDYSPAPLPDWVNEALKIGVYRVIQEGLTNAAKHASGANKTLSVVMDDDAVMIDLADDGPGLPTDPSQTEARPHLGLKGMHNRVLALHGSVSIKSAPGRGTRLLVRLPLESTGNASV